MPQYPVASDNSILTGGLPLFMSFEACGTIFPGDLVEFCDPVNGDCRIQAGSDESDEIVGVADLSAASAGGPATSPRGSGRTLHYNSGDQVAVIRGPITLMLRLATSEQIQCGEMVQPAASGEVKAFVCGTDNDCERIAQSLETLAQNTTSFQWLLCALERCG